MELYFMLFYEKPKILIFLVLLSVQSVLLNANPKDSLPQVSLVEFRMSNDLFQLKHRSDKYFSAGFFLAVAHEVFDNKFSRFILLGSKESSGNFGIFISQKGYTPQDLFHPDVIYDDRPYCGTLSAHIWRESSNLQRNINYVSYLKVGVSGPPSMVDRLQLKMHDWLGATTPMGWDNQIGTSLIVDYYFKVRKSILPYNGWFQMGASLEAEVGTFIGATAGEAGLKIGWFNNELVHHRGIAAHGVSSKRNFQLFLRAEIRQSFVFFDGTLQGGLIPFESSPHTFGWSDYNHTVTLYTYKLIYSYKQFFVCYRKTLEYSQFFNNEFFGFGTFDIVFPF